MRTRRLSSIPVLAMFGVAAFVACQSPDYGVQTPAPLEAAATSPYVVEVVAEDYAFQAPDAIPSGWVTFRMQNVAENHHFALLTRLPEDRTLDDYMVDVAAHFVHAIREMQAGRMNRAEAAQMLGREVPAWFGSAQRIGGPALLAAGGVSEVTLYLEPGEYFMECYMKTPEGEFHAMEGMIRPFTVTADASGAAPPAADLEITLTNNGIEAPEGLAAGRHVIAVRFLEHPERGGAHDLHLARLDQETDAKEIVPWMDWMDPHGLRDPSPATFMGGTQEMPAGNVAYVALDLPAGRYAWISQMTAPQGMVHEFTVR